MAHHKLNLVKNMIMSDFAVIFSKTYCPYCRNVKRLLFKLNEPYTSYELDKRKDGEDIQDVLEQMTGARTVPRIFIKGECLGGASDFHNMYTNGSLRGLFKQKNEMDELEKEE